MLPIRILPLAQRCLVGGIAPPTECLGILAFPWSGVDKQTLRFRAGMKPGGPQIVRKDVGVKVSVGFIDVPDDRQEAVAVLSGEPCDGSLLPSMDITGSGRIRPDFLYRRRMAGNDRHERFLILPERPRLPVHQRHHMGLCRLVMEPPDIGQSHTVDDLGRLRVGDMGTGAFPAFCFVQDPRSRAAEPVRLPCVGFDMNELETHCRVRKRNASQRSSATGGRIQTGVVTDYSYSASLP